MTRSLRFVQLSDVHLDSVLRSSALRLPPGKRETRRSELRAVVTRARELALDHEADCLLIPGDLWDDETVSADTVAFLVDELAKAPCPVVITPGNHDYYSPGSFYHAPYLQARLGLRWPENVYVITSPQWCSIQVPGLADVAFTGICFTTNVPITRRYLAERLPKAPNGLNILIFHGSREGHAPAGKRVTLPFSDEELLNAGFEYAAIGHYHSFSVIRDHEGRVRGAYSGCPAGRGLDECGEKVVLAGVVEPGRGATLEPVRLDRRTIHVVDVDCTGLPHRDAVLRLVEERVRSQTVHSDDIVYVRLTGRVSAAADVTFPDGFLADRYFHVQFDASALYPDYNLEVYRTADDDTIEARFARKLLADLDRAATDEERGRIERALYYGLDALKQGRVKPRHAS